MATAGVKIGRVIFDILKNNVALLSITGMSAGKIQPAPLREQGNASIGIVYETSAVNVVNVKRELRPQTAPLYIVDFTLECFSTDYSVSILLADYASQALEHSAYGTHDSVRVNGITLESFSEDYNKARRYYSKRLSFQARVLL